mgnify:CR=1 FL=1
MVECQEALTVGEVTGVVERAVAVRARVMGTTVAIVETLALAMALVLATG